MSPDLPEAPALAELEVVGLGLVDAADVGVTEGGVGGQPLVPAGGSPRHRGDVAPEPDRHCRERHAEARAPVGPDRTIGPRRPGLRIGGPGGGPGELAQVRGGHVRPAALDLGRARDRLLAGAVGPGAGSADVGALALAFRTLAFALAGLLLADQGEAVRLLLLGQVAARVVRLVAVQEVVPLTLTRIGAGDPAAGPELGLLLDRAAVDAATELLAVDRPHHAVLELAGAVLVRAAVVEGDVAVVAVAERLAVARDGVHDAGRDGIHVVQLVGDALSTAVQVEEAAETGQQQHRAHGLLLWKAVFLVLVLLISQGPYSPEESTFQLTTRVKGPSSMSSAPVEERST